MDWLASLEKEIATHPDKIKNPGKHIPGFDKLAPGQQNALVEKKWPADVQKQLEHADILQGLLDRIGQQWSK